MSVSNSLRMERFTRVKVPPFQRVWKICLEWGASRPNSQPTHTGKWDEKRKSLVWAKGALLVVSLSPSFHSLVQEFTKFALKHISSTTMASSAPNSQSQASKPVPTPAPTSEQQNSDATTPNEADSYYSAALWTSTWIFHLLIHSNSFSTLLSVGTRRFGNFEFSHSITDLICVLSIINALESIGFVKEFPIAIQRPVEQLMTLEYEAGKARQELTALHQQRLDHHTVLQQKREQILADIAQYLQPFTETMSLPSLRKWVAHSFVTRPDFPCFNCPFLGNDRPYDVRNY